MPNYQEGKIYKIMNDETDEIYIGSTCSSLAKRYAKHKYNYNSYKNNKENYITSFKIFDYLSSKIILIELFPCNSKEELTAREAYYIKLLPCVNKIIPLRTEQEYKEYYKQYRDENKDKIKEYRKVYYEEHKEDEKQYRDKNKERQSFLANQFQKVGRFLKQYLNNPRNRHKFETQKIQRRALMYFLNNQYNDQK
jgi:hypothetical protein